MKLICRIITILIFIFFLLFCSIIFNLCDISFHIGLQSSKLFLCCCYFIFSLGKIRTWSFLRSWSWRWFSWRCSSFSGRRIFTFFFLCFLFTWWWWWNSQCLFIRYIWSTPIARNIFIIIFFLYFSLCFFFFSFQHYWTLV